MDNRDNENWDLIIEPKTGWFNLHLGDVWGCRDLIGLFVKRDFVTFYKQTILGPLWYIIQPIFNTIVFTIIFGKIAKIPTDGIPPFLFYLSGNVVWGYFAHCLTGTSNTFVSNAGIFGKVYFPRISVPISVVITGVFQFIIQFMIFLGFYFYFMINGSDLNPSFLILLLPLLIFQMAILGLGMGTLISALTTKYRDLTFAMGFCVQLWMYLTPIVYPLSQVPERYRIIYVFNPMASIVELFRAAFLGINTVEPLHIAISIGMTVIIFLTGIMLFNKIEKTFMDTV
jgi:lipopolysaccharide transport system permease protein